MYTHINGTAAAEGRTDRDNRKPELPVSDALGLIRSVDDSLSCGRSVGTLYAFPCRRT